MVTHLVAIMPSILRAPTSRAIIVTRWGIYAWTYRNGDGAGTGLKNSDSHDLIRVTCNFRMQVPRHRLILFCASAYFHFFFYFIGPILWGHSGPLCHAFVVVVVVVDIDAQAAYDSSDT